MLRAALVVFSPRSPSLNPFARCDLLRSPLSIAFELGDQRCAPPFVTRHLGHRLIAIVSICARMLWRCVAPRTRKGYGGRPLLTATDVAFL
ncbi:hypothetical protein C8Q73DRAFT_707686 [Cubamyces lactineus]|nr:hypothetical protein C8Q73DRAFT_707686 [Cubamyces lactineus]